MATTERDERGRFVAGCSPGPGRPKKTSIPGDEIARLARPLSGFELIDFMGDVRRQAEHRLAAATDSIEAVHLANRELAAIVLHRRLQAEASGKA